MFTTAIELLERTKQGKTIWQVVLERECQMNNCSEQDVYKKLKETLAIMRSSATNAKEQDVDTVAGLIKGDCKKVEAYRKTGNTLCGDLINSAMSKALSCSEVNASMGRICAAPTAGACGILPATLLACEERLNPSETQLLNALLTASGIGIIITANATVSGAEGGCQAECGSAASMAAAAVVELAGGDVQTALHASSIALKNIMGLICDPIAGLVESPCAKRNASGVVNALISADLALAGIPSVIPFDQVVEAMYKVGRMMPMELRETALGGIAATPAGQEIQQRIFGKS